MPIPNPENPLHVRIRRTKRVLRFVPRRARFHTYPVIGRFTALVRQRAHLWSFKSASVRPALYAGSILSLLPVMGVQLPIAFALSLLLRANFMVLGGLQFLTNPLTAAPIYYATYLLGKTILGALNLDLGFAPEAALVAPPDSGFSPGPEVAGIEPLPAEPRLGRRIGSTVNSLVVGGIVTGSLLGFVLDLLHRRLRAPASGSTDLAGRPQ